MSDRWSFRDTWRVLNAADQLPTVGRWLFIGSSLSLVRPLFGVFADVHSAFRTVEPVVDAVIDDCFEATAGREGSSDTWESRWSELSTWVPHHPSDGYDFGRGGHAVGGPFLEECELLAGEVMQTGSPPPKRSGAAFGMCRTAFRLVAAHAEGKMTLGGDEIDESDHPAYVHVVHTLDDWVSEAGEWLSEPPAYYRSRAQAEAAEVFELSAVNARAMISGVASVETEPT